MATQTSTDRELLNACANNDRKAQYQLHQRYYGRLLGVCLRYIRKREVAEEVLNEAFCKIFQKAATYRAEGDVAAWMIKLTVYTAIDQVRKEAKYKQVFFPGLIPDRPIENEVMDNMNAEGLLLLIRQLPKASRMVFNLYVVEGYSHPEIAELLNISTGTSKWHLNNARKKLQTRLQKRKARL